MKRLVVSAAVLALGVTGIGTSVAGNDSGQGAQKRPLYVAPTQADDAECESSESTEVTKGAAAGFVILNAPGKVGSVEKIVGTVSLKEGTPDTTYAVFLAQNGTCVLADTLTTNKQGNGNAHIDLPGTGGAYYVVLQDATMQQRFASAPVNLI